VTEETKPKKTRKSKKVTLPEINLQELTQLVTEMAREVAKEDPIDFAYLSIDEKQIFELMSSHIVEKYAQYRNTEEGQVIFLATITKLVVENFVLNYKWQKKYRGQSSD
jgi:hypothetical protein